MSDKYEQWTDKMKYEYWKGNNFEQSSDGTYRADGLKWKEEEVREAYWSLNAERWRELPGEHVITDEDGRFLRMEHAQERSR